ncbi:MAG: hypothetical protein COT81_03025 [Candidatus Buchananbacteria bacterium CG10_big_fil_rev_8_21_14_0_10_42_9]|uniref:Metal-sensitive transcriptional regulator n=1 Tax=Candidatus Buchananbacteria bacterium CG10_big_fil_rev_8_21_14_0_10_42_9 TaxID=1974526 RepID=A0A2H0W164_9BACT|nr:MAG: hypothetical protein COT81_03025 [Candidatus Buchananbacteria bacterium CG10_big_fil_rev_8_21_14_0_10_42_9]
MCMEHSRFERHKKTIHHINRIEGQLKVLKRYITEDKPCHDIAHLTASVAESFNALKIRTLEGFVLHELTDKKTSEKKRKEKLTKIINLYK